MAKIAVLGSGAGSNFLALHQAFGDEIVIVVSDVADAEILAKAQQLGVPTAIEPAGPDLAERLVARLPKIDLICLAGYMQLVKAPLLQAFPNRILNIHPSLLPKYPGLSAWKQALADGARETGCTAHFVDAGIDTGEVILQAKVRIQKTDTPETLHTRIKAAEHRIYPEAVQMCLARLMV